MDDDAPTYGEAQAAFIADQMCEHRPRVFASDILRYIKRFNTLPLKQKAQYRIEKVDA